MRIKYILPRTFRLSSFKFLMLAGSNHELARVLGHKTFTMHNVQELDIIFQPSRGAPKV